MGNWYKIYIEDITLVPGNAYFLLHNYVSKEGLISHINCACLVFISVVLKLSFGKKFSKVMVQHYLSFQIY